MACCGSPQKFLTEILTQNIFKSHKKLFVKLHTFSQLVKYSLALLMETVPSDFPPSLPPIQEAAFTNTTVSLFTVRLIPLQTNDKNQDSHEFMLQEESQLLELLTNACPSYILTLACSQILQRKMQMALFDFSSILHKIHLIKMELFLC